MKRLLLLRHAKTEPAEEARVPDIERRLLPIGQAAARRMGMFLVEQGIQPAAILCSNAQRTVETMNILMHQLKQATPMVRVEAELYMGTPGTILKHLRKLPAEIESVLVIGHNPGLEELALDMPTQGNLTAYQLMHRKFPPGGLAILNCPVTRWQRLETRTAEMVDFVRPDQV
jgi:phosphohistidine phosphatase